MATLLVTRNLQTRFRSQLQRRRIHQHVQESLVRGPPRRAYAQPFTPAVHFVDSESSSSNLTSSDKLSALPGFQSSPAVGRIYGGTRTTPRRSFEASSSLPAIQSSPALGPLQRISTPASNHSASESSVHGRDTPRQRVSFDSERGTLPTALRNFRQGVCV